MYYMAKYRAKKKCIEFSIEITDIVIPEFCPVLGLKLENGSGKGKFANNSPSLDRIDSSKGYTKGNVRVISWRANSLKKDATFHEIEKIYKDLKNIHETSIH